MTFHLSLGGPGLPSANLPAGPGERKRGLERNPECSKAGSFISRWISWALRGRRVLRYIGDVSLGALRSSQHKSRRGLRNKVVHPGHIGHLGWMILSNGGLYCTLLNVFLLKAKLPTAESCSSVVQTLK